MWGGRGWTAVITINPREGGRGDHARPREKRGPVKIKREGEKKTIL